MDKAKLIHNETLQERTIFAKDFSELIRNLKDWKSVYTIYEPGTNRQVSFVPYKKSQGFSKPVYSHFRRIFNGKKVTTDFIKSRRKETPKTFEQHLQDGQKVLINLNFDLMHNHVNPKTDEQFNAWKYKNIGAYQAVSINDIQSLIKKLDKIKTIIPEAYAERVFVSYRKYILPIDEFDLRNHQEKLTPLFKKIHTRAEGAVFNPADAIKKNIGFPRLFDFYPTQNTLKEKAKSRVQGNVLYPADDPFGEPSFLQQLVFTTKDYKCTESFNRFSNLFEMGYAKKLIVLGCPYADIDPQKPIGNLKLKFQKIVINDIDKQIKAPEHAKSLVIQANLPIPELVKV